jgi:hypothetical protein
MKLRFFLKIAFACSFATERKLRDAQNEILDLRTKLDEVGLT